MAYKDKHGCYNTRETLGNVHNLKVFECIVDIIAYLWLL